MPLAHAVNQRLSELRVVLEVEGRVLLVELVEPGGELVLFTALVDEHRGRGDGVGIGDRRQPDRSITPAEGVVGVRVPQLRHRGDVSRLDALDLDPVPPLLEREVVELLGDLMFRVPHFVAGADRTGVEPEEGHVAHVGLRDGLEHVADERRIVARPIPGTLRLERLEGIREELHHLVEERPHAVGELPAPAEEGDDLSREHRPLHHARDFLAPDRLATQVPLDERVVGGGDRLGELVGVLREALAQLLGDLDDLVLPGLRALPEIVALPREQIDDAVEVVPVADGDLDGNHLRGEVVPHVAKDRLEVRVLLVHRGDEENARQVQLVADLPDLLGPDLDAGRPAQDHHGRVGGVETAHGLAEVIEISGCIEEVQLGVHPLGVREAEGDGVLAIDFVGGVIGECGAIPDRAVAAAGTGDEGQRVDEGRLAAGSVAHEGHISDGVGAIDLHGLHLLPNEGF